MVGAHRPTKIADSRLPVAYSANEKREREKKRSAGRGGKEEEALERREDAERWMRGERNP
jgi:Ni/Co efflux regulator RcnB